MVERVLNTRLDAQLSQHPVERCFEREEDGREPAVVHERCDNKRPTVTVGMCIRL